MFEFLRERLATWRAYRETLSRLQALDDHILADAGFERGKIRARVWRILREQGCW